MDKRLCLWDRSQLQCKDLVGHNGSISKVKVDSRNVAISAAYDAALLIWVLDSLECAQGLFKGHKDAVLDFEWVNSLCVSGDRSGGLALWDVNTGKTLKQEIAHNGGVSKIKFLSDESNSVYMSTGLKDGVLNVYDMRTQKTVSKDRVHGGAINFLGVTPNGEVITSSADKSIKMFQIGNSKPISVQKTTDSVFCGDIYGDKVVVGCGDGNILTFDTRQNLECVWGYGVDEVGAVHCLKVLQDGKSIITGGDAGQPLKVNLV